MIKIILNKRKYKYINNYLNGLHTRECGGFVPSKEESEQLISDLFIGEMAPCKKQETE